jgi:hypothetical protein
MTPDRPPTVEQYTTAPADLHEVIRKLFARGCGAVVGHGGCNLRTKPILVICNQSMSFLLWRTTWSRVLPGS